MTLRPRLQRSIAIVDATGQPMQNFQRWWDLVASAAESSGTTGIFLTDGDKGDITVSASGLTWTIDPSTITLAKMANVASGTVFYRKTAAAGAPEVQTLATLKTDLGLTGTNSGDQTITLTGDITGSGTASFATTLATVNGSPGVFGSTTVVPVVTVNAKGLVTSITTATIAGTVSTVSVVTANGVSGSVATATTTPAITLTLGNITPTSVSAGGSIGYATGQGGTIGQATSRTTGVILNKLCGEITLFSTTTTAGANTTFDVTNSTFAATDHVILNIKSNPSGNYILEVRNKRAGVFAITVNTPAAVAVAEAPVISFMVLKSVNA